MFRFKAVMSMISYSMTIVDNDQFISSGKVFKLLFLPGIYAKIMHHFFLEIVTSTHIVLDTLVLNFGSLLVIDSCPINISSLSCLFYLSILFSALISNFVSRLTVTCVSNMQ